MSQTDYVVANASGAAFRADLNDQLGAIVTQNSGSSFPGTTFARMVVVNTTTGAKYRRNLANSGWLVIDTDDETRVVSRSSNTILDVSDFSKTVIATSSFTQTLDAAATLGDGWWCHYRNDGTGTIVLDPNSSETIDGATTLTLLPGGSCTIVCNGSAFKTVGRVNLAGDVKAWVRADTGGNALASFNVSSVTDQGPGQVAPVWNIDFADLYYVVVANAQSDVAVYTTVHNSVPPALGTAIVDVFNTSGVLTDPNYYHVLAIGNQ